MQTFLPYEDFEKSARVLDDKRLGKQRSESIIILKTLLGVYEKEGRKGWPHHPATKMWAGHEVALLAEDALEINGTAVVIGKLDGIDPKSLRDTMDQLKNRIGSGVALLATAKDGKVSLIAGVTKDLTSKVRAGDLVKMVAEQVGGKGGGRPDMAQAGGTDVAALPGALESASSWLAEKL